MREVVNQGIRLVAGRRATGGDILRGNGVQHRAEGEPLRRPGVRLGLGLLYLVNHVGKGKQGLVDAHDRQLPGPQLVIQLRHVCRPPKSRPRIGIDRVADVDLGHLLRPVGPHLQPRDAVCRLEAQLSLGCFGKGEGSLQMLVKPQRPRDGELRREAVVHVRREGVADNLVRDQLSGAVGVVHDAVEVVGGAEPEERRFDVRGVRLESQRRLKHLHVAFRRLLSHLREQRPRLRPETRSADRGCSGPHPAVAAGDVHGEAAPHRVAVHTELVGVDFRLLLQERQAPSGPQGEQVPIVVSGRVERVDGLVAGLEGEVARHVPLCWIDRPPVGVWVAVPGPFHLAPAPIHRQAGVSPPGVKLGLVERRALPATVQIEQRRRLLRPLREGVKRGQACRDALERADVKRDGAGHDPVLFPLPHELGVERVVPGIEVGKQLRDRGGGLRLGGDKGERQQADDADQNASVHVIASP